MYWYANRAPLAQVLISNHIGRLLYERCTIGKYSSGFTYWTYIYTIMSHSQWPVTADGHCVTSGYLSVIVIRLKCPACGSDPMVCVTCHMSLWFSLALPFQGNLWKSVLILSGPRTGATKRRRHWHVRVWWTAVMSFKYRIAITFQGTMNLNQYGWSWN